MTFYSLPDLSEPQALGRSAVKIEGVMPAKKSESVWHLEHRVCLLILLEIQRPQLQSALFLRGLSEVSGNYGEDGPVAQVSGERGVTSQVADGGARRPEKATGLHVVHFQSQDSVTEKDPH